MGRLKKGTRANAKKKKKKSTLTHDPGPTPQLIQNTWPRITGKSKYLGYLAQYLTKEDLPGS